MQISWTCPNAFSTGIYTRNFGSFLPKLPFESMCFSELPFEYVFFSKNLRAFYREMLQSSFRKMARHAAALVSGGNNDKLQRI